MNLLKEIFAHEVFPAIGCTEPISCAYTTAAAVEQLGVPVDHVELVVDSGTYKNGAAVTIPYSNEQKGNVIAAAMGAMVAKSSAKLEILKEVTPEILKKAEEFVKKGALKYRCKEGEKSFYVEVIAEGKGSKVHCIVSAGHTNITTLEKNGKSILDSHPHKGSKIKDYHEVMRKMKLEEVLNEVIKLDKEARTYIQRGIDMNMAISEKGLQLKRTGYQLQHMVKQGLMADDVFYKAKWRVASAVDARMGGMPEPAMTSGGSGNQGMLTIIVPYIVGLERKVKLPVIQESIAISHSVNSYIKCFIGELSVLCGCAIAAGIASAIALVYQEAGVNMQKINFAMDNVVGDLCGLICDGAKSGCSMKIVSGAETAIRSAFMALAGYGLSTDDGVIGSSPEESIRNLGMVSLEGMFRVDPTVVHILKDKSARSGLA